MKTTLDYLNLVISRNEGISNANQLAVFLGVTRQAIYQYQGGQNMSVLVALKLSKVLDLHPMGPVAATMYAQAKTQEERDFWQEEYDRVTAGSTE